MVWWWSVLTFVVCQAPVPAQAPPLCNEAGLHGGHLTGYREEEEEEVMEVMGGKQFMQTLSARSY